MITNRSLGIRAPRSSVVSSIQAGPASLYIPPGALDRYVTITATVPRDSRACSAATHS